MTDHDPNEPAGQGFSLGEGLPSARSEIHRTGASILALRDNMRGTALIGRQFGSAIAGAFDGLALKGRSLGDTIRTLGLSLSSIAFKAAFRPLEQAFANGLTGLLAGAATGGDGKFAAAALASGTPTLFAKGGVIAAPVAFPLGGGVGIAGERGAEAIMPLTRGPDGRLGVAASGGGGVSVTFNVTTADADSFRRSEAQLAAMLARAVGSGQRNL